MALGGVMLLSDNDIKAELSHAYLHAVASRAGFECWITGRHSDHAGIDAVIRAKERFSAESVFTDFPLEIQLKATSQEPIHKDGRYSFVLPVEHYDKTAPPRPWRPGCLSYCFCHPTRRSGFRTRSNT